MLSYTVRSLVKTSAVNVDITINCISPLHFKSKNVLLVDASPLLCHFEGDPGLVWHSSCLDFYSGVKSTFIGNIVLEFFLLFELSWAAFPEVAA